MGHKAHTGFSMQVVRHPSTFKPQVLLWSAVSTKVHDYDYAMGDEEAASILASAVEDPVHYLHWSEYWNEEEVTDEGSL